MKLRDFLAIAILIVVAIAGRVMTDGPPPDIENPRRPDPGRFEPPAPKPPTESGRPLPAESRRDPRLIVEIEEKKGTSVGTAFSIDPSGVWITAHHVTSGCDLVGLQKNDGKLVRVLEVSERADADIRILRTRGGRPRMKVIRPQLRIGEDGYSFGYPQGIAGDVHGRVIGRGRMLTRGRYRKDEPVIAWTQVKRIPDRGPDLSGISGGPWVNARGEVVGVHVAGSPRRGRSYSTAPRLLIDAVRSSGASTFGLIEADSAKALLNPVRFADYGTRLRRDLIVAKVVCLVGEKWRRLARERS